VPPYPPGDPRNRDVGGPAHQLVEEQS
jgi:hypothetical protein